MKESNMQNQDIITYIIAIIDALKDVIIGSFGGIVAYMYDYSKQKKDGREPSWSTATMLINMFIGGFTANTFGEFIPIDMTGRDGIVGLIGVSSYAIIGIVESKFGQLMVNRFLK